MIDAQPLLLRPDHPDVVHVKLNTPLGFTWALAGPCLSWALLGWETREQIGRNIAKSTLASRADKDVARDVQLQCIANTLPDCQSTFIAI